MLKHDVSLSMHENNYDVRKNDQQRLCLFYA